MLNTVQQIKKQAVAETTVKLMDVGSTLIYVGRSNMVLSQSRELLKIFEEKKHYAHMEK